MADGDRSGALPLQEAGSGLPQEQNFHGSGAATRPRVYHFLFASGFATLRALSTKSCTTGLSVRFLSVTIPLGT
jgi:hypothetical protein